MKMKHAEVVKAQEKKEEIAADDENFRRRGRPRMMDPGHYLHQGFRMDPAGLKYL